MQGGFPVGTSQVQVGLALNQGEQMRVRKESKPSGSVK